MNEPKIFLCGDCVNSLRIAKLEWVRHSGKTVALGVLSWLFRPERGAG
jgi:hypothetical protein